MSKLLLFVAPELPFPLPCTQCAAELERRNTVIVSSIFCVFATKEFKVDIQLLCLRFFFGRNIFDAQEIFVIFFNLKGF